MGSKKKKSNNSGAGDSAGGSENGKKKEIQMIEDPRFSMIHTDPRFQRVPKKTDKIAIDSRFSQIFTDKLFAGSSAKVDKRGKPKKQSENGLSRFYHLEEDEEEKDEVKKKKKSVVKKVEDESEENSSDSLASESSGESSESELEGDSESDDDSLTSDSDDDEAGGVDVSEDDESVEVENVPVIDSETHRLAVVNMDWNQVKAVDIFMMLRSFLPKEGQIKSVTVYPSEFGLKRMEEEAVRGPVALLGDEKKKYDEGTEDEDEDEDEDENKDDDDDDDDDEIDTEKLRAYEKSRLRYYFAVVECDSIATADYIYKACDGVEFERSSNVLDLRFIPDSMEFPHPPRDVAKEAPANYEGLDFQTRALQQSNVTLSWDDDEPHRVKTLRRKFNDNQLAELELKEFLASDESESDSDEDVDEDVSEDDADLSDKVIKKARKTKMKAKMAKKDMYRALVQSGNGSEDDEDEGQDMEVTFNTGLEDLSKKILEKKDKGSESVWEAYLRKKKEKKKARKYSSKNSSDDDSDESDQEPLEQTEDFFVEDPSTVKSKKVKHGKKNREEKRPLEDEETAATTAELELLLADEKGTDNNLKGYKIKPKKGKGKKGNETPDEDNLPAVDYDDPRFSALFTNPAFSLDPTDPQFKRSATYFRQLAQRQHNDREEDTAIAPVELSRPSSNGSSRKEDDNSEGASRKEKFELSSMVKSIKMKSQQLPKPSSDKLKKGKTEHGSTIKEKKHKLEGLDHKMKKKARL
ncbi:pre-rRNA-processing protein esf1-like [Chenopodium quinoa]|uniref:pre-rRNA-processing protein esf1-like n=1 Tax=Chenopodium quinoa TaxID=63459 RepID=UPI000B787CE9|nr:pre-rRNA-processing protein esf1-like [Chenopodium quinoa]